MSNVTHPETEPKPYCALWTRVFQWQLLFKGHVLGGMKVMQRYAGPAKLLVILGTVENLAMNISCIVRQYLKYCTM